MPKRVLRELKLVQPGDLVCVEWADASRAMIETAKMMREAGATRAIIDSPVKTFGVFIGVFGARSKHIVLVASLWQHTQDYGQVDTTIIPIGVVERITLIAKNVLDGQKVKLCQTSFMLGRCFHLQERFQIKGRKFAETK